MTPLAGRRRSWKTSSQHRKPNANVGLNDLAATQYSRQLNPYKGSAKTSLRGSNGSKDNSVTRRPSASDDDLGIADGDVDLGESDDDLGLEDILSSITGLKDGKDEGGKKLSYKPASKKSEANTNGDSTKSNDTTQPPSSSGGTESASSKGESTIFEEKKDLLKEILDANPPGRPQISEVDFGKDFRAHRRLTPPVNNTSSADDEISLVSDGDDTLDNTLWTDGDATRQHKLMLQEDDQAPAFSSGFGDNNARLESMPLTGPSLPTGTKGGGGGNSLVDSLLEDVATINGDNSETEPKKPPPHASNGMKTPLRGGRFSSARYQRTKLHDGPQSSRTPASDENGSEKPLVIQKKEDDTTLSTVTDPSESPFIYTYKKDDDSVSQITSSVATSLGSSLQNIPSNFGSNRRKGTGLSRMGTGPGMGGIGSGGRMTQRKGKMVIPGPYGRDRNRRSAKKSSGRDSGSCSGSGSGSQGGSGSYDGSGNLDDEIALFALNADSRPRRASRRSPRTNSREALGMMGDDLSTVQSSTYQQPSHHMSHSSSVDLKSNVSRLGMGGVSCGASDASVTSDTSTSTLGLIQSVSLFAWKAKHYAGRFFLPTSSDVERRKKYDRADSMSDIEEMLAEEGANTLPHRKQKGSRHGNDDESEEIDYFGRAMSASGLRSPKKAKSRKKYFWQGQTARIVSPCLLLAVAITIWRMSSKEGERAPTLVQPDNGEFRAGKQRQYEGGEQEDSPEAQQQHFVQLPSNFDSLANVEDPFQRGDDVPFYWHVPRSGGGTMNDALGSCLHLALAADAGGSEGHGQEETLKVLHFSRQVSYVNVDTSTHQGIARAKNLGLASSGLADVVISPLLYDASTLFTPTRKGRMFTMLRHPVERAASLFLFIQETQWKQPGSRNEQFADISIEEFYKKGLAENNWMTRFLTNELSGELSEDNLTVAKEVLRQKCLVGLLEEKGESFERMLNYFGWQPKNDDELECLEKKLEYAWPMKHKHPKVESGTRALIEEANQLDLRLYEYAKDLFTQQAELFPR